LTEFEEIGTVQFVATFKRNTFEAVSRRGERELGPGTVLGTGAAAGHGNE
jgi:hypothetical protein